MNNYGMTKEINKNFEEAEKIVTDLLQKEGFGILTKIDVKQKFKEKLDVDFTNYCILGACNPPFAYKALNFDINLGLLLPCNVIIYEKESKTFVSIIKPTVAMNMIDSPELASLATEIEDKLIKVLEEI